MKIQVRSIHPNPYRNFERNPLIPERVKQLTESIKSTDFWDNIVVRPSPNGSGYELAYGHHRLEAVKQAGIKTVDIPVKDISDTIMVKMMADENLMQWGRSPAATLEAIEAARDLLEWALSEAETPEEFRAYSAVSADLKPSDWQRMKNNVDADGVPMVGSPLIRAMLGGAWSLSVINESLKVLNADREAAKLEAQEAAAKDEEVKAEQERKAEEARVRAEEAKAAALAQKKAEAEEAKRKAEAEKKAAREADAKRKAQEAIKKAQTAAKKAEAQRKAAEKRRKEAEANAIRARLLADEKRKAAAKAHADKQRLTNRVSRDTFEGFATQRQASDFATAVGKLAMTEAERKRCGEYCIKNDISSRAMATTVQQWWARHTVAGRKAATAKAQKKAVIEGRTLDDVISGLNTSLPSIISLMEQVEPFLEHIEHKGVKSTYFKRVLDELAPIVNKTKDRMNALNKATTSIN